MNEFIVWDEEEEKFIDESKCVFANGTLFRNEKDFANEISDDLSMFWSVGKKDIKGNKIYADCSIFEFEFNSIKYIGVFFYEAKRL